MMVKICYSYLIFLDLPGKNILRNKFIIFPFLFLFLITQFKYNASQYIKDNNKKSLELVLNVVQDYAKLILLVAR